MKKRLEYWNNKRATVTGSSSNRAFKNAVALKRAVNRDENRDNQSLRDKYNLDK